LSRIDSELLLVGSVPLRTPAAVFRMFGSALGSQLAAIPDGEPGDRSMWVDFLAARTYHEHPKVETIYIPTATGHPDDWKSTTLENLWQFRLKPGVTRLRFERLLYAEDAINSYHVFHDLRERGDLPASLRFQVCVPATASATLIYFRDAADRKLVDAAYEEGMEREFAQMLETIPADDLVIQFDVCPELLDLEQPLPWTSDTPADERFDGYVSSIHRLLHAVPDEVPVGYHFCYGTLGGWPTVPMPNLALSVRYSNAVLSRASRTVDYIHMPTPREIDDAFVQALQDLALDSENTKVYLGIIHPEDGLDGLRARAKIVSTKLSNYGAAYVCGFGRLPANDLPQLIDIHKAAAGTLAGAGP
jgi:hypothetical protein